jgi:Cu2+-exporting ATPase
LDELERYQPRQVEKGRPVDDGSPAFQLILSSIGIVASFAVEAAAPVMPLILLASALPMLSRAFDAVTRRDRMNVDVLDASATALLAIQGKVPMALCMVWLVNLGDYIRDATMRHAQAAITEVLAYRRYPAWVMRDGHKLRVSVDSIQVGDTIVIYPGERIPADGHVLDGQAVVDQQALTGESVPVLKGVGDKVYAATVLQDGQLYVKAQRLGDETEAATVVRLVEYAPAQETRVQNYAEQWADELVPYSFMAAGVSGVTGAGLQGAASMLIVDYGTGIRIAAPTTVLASMTKAMRHGLLIKGGRYLEQLAAVDAVVFDKTGTLTAGHPEVWEVVPHNGHVAADVLTMAAAAEQRLEHPMAKCIVRAAEQRNLSIPSRGSFDYAVGRGVEASVNGTTVLVGSARFMRERGVMLPKGIQRDMEEIEQHAVSPLCVAADGLIMGVLACADAIRTEAREVIIGLRARGVRQIVMLTGDRHGVAQRVADELGVTRYVAELFPTDKVEAVKRLQQDGYTVAVVGDGINDSPALAYADVGIAVEGGTDVARETADVVLLHGGLWKIPLAIDIGREAMELIQQNWQVIAIPNTVALGLAFAGLMGPGATTVLSNGSAVVATANALRPLFSTRTRVRHSRATTIRSRATSATDRTSACDNEGSRPLELATTRGAQADAKQSSSFSLPKIA